MINKDDNVTIRIKKSQIWSKTFLHQFPKVHFIKIVRDNVLSKRQKQKENPFPELPQESQ